MKKVLIIDPNLAFAHKLQQTLNPSLKPYAEIEVLAKPLDHMDRADLVIIHESFHRLYPDLSQAGRAAFLVEDWVADGFTLDFISRKSKSSDWKSFIMYNLDINQTIQLTNIVYSVFIFSSADRLYHLNNLLFRLANQGKKVFVLPVKPSYAWQYDAAFCQGPNLSDYILQLEGGIDLTAEDIGHLFEGQKSGLFLPRPGSSADDIYHCDSRDLLELVSLFRDFIKGAGKDTVGIIDMESIPFSLAKDISFISDVSLMDIPEKGDFGSGQAKKKIAGFLAEKPETTSFIPLDIYEETILC